MSQNKNTYFPALDGLRFAAFLLVFFHHVTFYLRQDALSSPFWKFFRVNGWVGVDIFFALTGFLITYLLLLEREARSSFSLRRFHLRRIVRIWPLYFLAILVGYFFAPFFFQNVLGVNYLRPNYSSQVTSTLPWLLTFLGNWKIVLSGYGGYRAISELWAIALDQQFYLLWPIILLFIKSLRTAMISSVGIILFSVLTRIQLVNVGVSHPGIYVNTFARLDTFMFGAILAFFLFYKPVLAERLKFLTASLWQLLALFVFVAFLFFSTLSNSLAIRNGIWGYLVTATFSTYFIFCLLKETTLVAKFLSLAPVRSLGQISFGLYVWHILALETVFYLLPTAANFWLALLGLPITILLGTISFNFFEKPFLQLKDRFK